MHTLSSSTRSTGTHPPTAQLYRVAILRNPVTGQPTPADLEHVEITAVNGVEALLGAMRSTGAYNAFAPELIGPTADVLALTARRPALTAVIGATVRRAA